MIPPPPALPVPGATSSGAGSNKPLSATEDKTKKAEEGGPSASEVDANASKEPLIDNREKKERTKSKRKDKSVDKKAGSGEEESPKVVEGKGKEETRAPQLFLPELPRLRSCRSTWTPL